ncbi:hypothetical protein EII20_05060 [Comamonadaceae bacterium OH2545_COT-014]|nr:hypothetical protein EII20_05060 [Comamonadaceae bacterium OH2545_COT-014]
MKPQRKHLLIATLLAALGAGASAQTAQTAQMAQTPPPAPASGEAAPQPGPRAQAPRHDPAQRHARMAQRHGQRMAALKEKLQLSAAQQGAWNQFANAMQPSATPPQRPDQAEFERLTTPERIDRMQALQAERQARMNQRGEAIKAFYAQLTPGQRQTFDAQMRGFRGFGPGAKGHKHHKGHRGHSGHKGRRHDHPPVNPHSH